MIDSEEDIDLFRGPAPDGMISALGKMLDSERMKRNALENARDLLNDLRFRTDWPDGEAINAAIDEWLNEWGEMSDV